MLHNARQYKLAKVFNRDIEAMLITMERALNDLGPYSRYVPAKDVLEMLNSSRRILLSHKEKCQKIIANKGAQPEPVVTKVGEKK